MCSGTLLEALGGEENFGKYSLSSENLIRDFFVPDDLADSLPTKTVSVYK